MYAIRSYYERHGHVLGQGHGTPQRPALIEDADPPHDRGPLVRIGTGEIPGAVADGAGHGLDQAGQDLEQGALAATAARITSYNVCYTKLLRVEIALAHGRSGWRSYIWGGGARPAVCRSRPTFRPFTRKRGGLKFFLGYRLDAVPATRA